MQAQTSFSVVTGQRTAPATMGHAIPGLSPSYQAELDTWARSQISGAIAVGRIKTWLASGDTSQALDLAGLSLTCLPPLPEQLKKLNAANNKLVYLPENLPRLVALDVSDNALTRLPQALPTATLKLLNVSCNELANVPHTYYFLQPGCEIYMEGNPGVDPRDGGLYVRLPDGCFCDVQYLQALMVGAVAKVKTMLAAFPGAAVCNFRNQDTPLFIAAGMGHVEIVENLLQHPDINVNRPGSTGDTPLLAALGARREDVALLLLARPDTDPNRRASTGGTVALHFALALKQYRAATLLLKRPDITPELADNQGQTALHYVIDSGDLVAMKLLLACPLVDIYNATPEKAAPIVLAAARGNVAVVEALLQKMTNNLTTRTRACSLALFDAAANGHVEVVALMLRKYRSDPNVCGHHSNIPPICVAAHYGHLDIVKLLLRFDANVNVRLPDGTPALMMGIAKGRMDIFKAMLFHPHVDPNFVDSAVGMSPLCFAAHTGALDFVKVLLTHKAVDVNYADKNSVTPLLRAAHGLHVAIIQCLLSDKRLMVNKAGKDGSTALIECCYGGSAAAVKLLLQHEKIDLYARRSNGGTALRMAAGTGQFSIVRLLMTAMMDGSNKARIEAANGLAQAVHSESAAMVELFLATGADPNQPGANGMVPLQLLMESAYDECDDKLKGRIMMCLLKAGARIDQIPAVNLQRKLAHVIGSHVIDVLIAATEPLKRKANGEQLNLMTDRGAKEMESIEDAERMLTTIANLPEATQCALLAGVALNSINAFDLILAEHPKLEKLIKIVHENENVDSRNKCERIHANMTLWDGGGIDGAGQGTFSVLRTARDRLPPCTKSILAAWKI